MRRAERFITLDDVEHKSLDTAQRHANKIYGMALSKHAHALVQLQKYTAILDYLDAHADELAYLKILSDDAIPPKMHRSQCDCNGIQYCDKCED